LVYKVRILFDMSTMMTDYFAKKTLRVAWPEHIVTIKGYSHKSYWRDSRRHSRSVKLRLRCSVDGVSQKSARHSGQTTSTRSHISTANSLPNSPTNATAKSIVRFG